MSKDLVIKNELIKLLDRGNQIDDDVYDAFDGEEFAFDKSPIKIEGLRSAFTELIPKTVWYKQDYVTTFTNLNIVGLDQQGRLLVGVDGETNTFSATSEAVNQMFYSMKMSTYANYLVDQEHLPILLTNFTYWFKEKTPDQKILVRTVVEGAERIARCFATPFYQPIDNHIVLFVTSWALDKSGFSFKVTGQQLKHSKMKMEFLSKESIKIQNVGEVFFGITVVNSEAKESTVEFHPICRVYNLDGTYTTMVVSKHISISHRGKSVDPIVRKLTQISNLREYAEQAAEVVRLASTAKVNEILAFKIQVSLRDIVGSTIFDKYAETYSMLSSMDTFNLLEFFGRLNEIQAEDDEKQLEIQRLFWKTLRDVTKK